MPAPSSPNPHGQAGTRLRHKHGPNSTPSDIRASAWSMTEMEWWAVIVAVVAFVALVAWVEAWFAAWVSDLIKNGMDKW